MPTIPDEKPPINLPPLREGLTFSFSDYDPDGKPQWLIHDSGRNKFFVIGWLEYEILSRWDMQDSQKLINDINDKTALHVDMQDVENVINFLAHNYLIKQSSKAIYQKGKEQKLFKDETLLHSLITYYLFFRIPLWHPNKFLTKTKYIANFVFNRYTLYVMTFLGIVAIYQVGTQWSDFTHTFSSIFTWEGLLFYFIAFSVCKFCHELGHAYMCKRYGVPVPTFGVAFLVFWPVLYTDTTLSWVLDSKQRLRIALAGIWVETYVTIIAALIWCNTSDTTIRSITYVVITVNWMSSLLINVSPFMRFDGYYVLADYLKIPNLQPRAFALARWQLRRWLFDWSDPPPEKFSPQTHWTLVIYSYITWLYRLMLYIGIAVLVYHFFIKIVGIVLFAIELFYFILGPIVNELTTWYQLRAKFSWNTRTIITTSIANLLLIGAFIPVKTTAKLPATLSYTHQFLVAPEEGMLASALPEPGTYVKAGQPIVVIKSKDLDYALQKIQLEYKKTLSELRRSTINPDFSSQQSVLLSTIVKEESENRKLLEMQNQLILKTSFNGLVVDVSKDLYPGAIVMKDEWIGDVIDQHSTQVEAYVSQQDLKTVTIGLTGYFYPASLSQSEVPVIVTSIEALNANQLDCRYSPEIKNDAKDDSVVETPCYNSSDLGGSIATYSQADGSLVPVESVYRVVLKTVKPVKIEHVERGAVFLKINTHSYAYRLIYQIKKILVEESGF